jgi:xanthine dehydrogenase accessory factor
MRELREILARARALSAAGSPAALATIVAVEGSSYRREGARLLLEPDGEATGVLSGGCLERDLARAAAEVVAGGAARTLVYDLTADDEAIYGLGLGCAGRVTLLVEPLAGAAGGAHETAPAPPHAEPPQVAGGPP